MKPERKDTIALILGLLLIVVAASQGWLSAA